MIDSTTVLSIIIATLIVAAYGGLGLRRWRALPETKESQLMTQVFQLRATVDVLIADRVRDQRRITELESQLIVAQQRITELEYQLKAFLPPGVITMLTPRRRLLACIGPDAKLEIDLAALRKVETHTGMDFRRLLPVTKANLKATLTRARVAGDPWRYVHMSCHMGPTGAVFGDGRGGSEIITAMELSEMLQDVEVLVLAGCESTTMGDLLGVVVAVITMQEEVRHDDAMNFTDVFWREIGSGTEAEAAYETACDRVPTVGEFAEFHQ